MNFEDIYIAVDKKEDKYINVEKGIIVNECESVNKNTIKLPTFPHLLYFDALKTCILRYQKSIMTKECKTEEKEKTNYILSEIAKLSKKRYEKESDLLKQIDEIFIFQEERFLDEDYDYFNITSEYLKKWCESNHIVYDEDSYIDFCKKKTYENYIEWKELDYNSFLTYKNIININLPTNGKFYINCHDNKLEVEFTGWASFNISDVSSIDQAIEKSEKWITIKDVNKNVLKMLPKYLEFEKFTNNKKYLIYNETLKKYNDCEINMPCILYVFSYLFNGKGNIFVKKIKINY